MLDGLYQNASAMSGLESWNNAIAQNLAQSAAPGFKKASVTFEGKLNGLMSYEGDFGKNIYHSATTASARGDIDYGQGEIRNTGDPFDFALEGEVFFQLRTPEGEYIYTRDGEFNTNAEGELVSKQDYHVMDDNRNVIQLIPEGGELTGAADGTLRQGGQKIAQMAVRSIDDMGSLIRAHGGFIIAQDRPSNDPLVRQPTIRHQSLENSNVKPTREMIEMMTVSRAFELNQKVIKNHDAILEKAIRTLAGRMI